MRDPVAVRPATSAVFCLLSDNSVLLLGTFLWWMLATDLPSALEVCLRDALYKLTFTLLYVYIKPVWR